MRKENLWFYELKTQNQLLPVRSYLILTYRSQGIKNFLRSTRPNAIYEASFPDTIPDFHCFWTLDYNPYKFEYHYQVDSAILEVKGTLNGVQTNRCDYRYEWSKCDN